MNDQNKTAPAGRIAYWPLRTDCRDASGAGRHGEPEAIRFADAARFDGIASSIRLPVLAETDGTRPFTLSLEFLIEDSRGFLPGGLCSRYGKERMEGWHLSLLTQAGVTSSQSNWRNLQFGWSSNRDDEEWQDWGSPGDSRLVCALCVHEGGLYAGTFDDARDHRGRVYRLGNDGTWIDCGNPDDSNSVWSLTEYNGRLFAGTMRYKAGGSSLTESPNQQPGGRIYRYEGNQSWSLFAELPGSDSVGALGVYEDRLIAMSYYTPGFYAYGPDGSCLPLGAPGPEAKTRTITFAPFRGTLYAGCNETTGVYGRKLDSPWEYCGTAPLCDQVYCFSVYHNELLMGIWREARMLAYEGGTRWSDRGMLGSEMEVMGVSVYNGKLYAGTLPGGHVYRYEGGTNWKLAGVLEPPDSDVRYRRVWSMAVYRGELFAGTLPSGKVWSQRSGPLATCDTGVPSGWHRAAITYDLHQLSLFLDGQLISSAQFPDDRRSLLDDIPLVLGQGPQCPFSGQMREVELFDRALSAEEISRY